MKSAAALTLLLLPALAPAHGFDKSAPALEDLQATAKRTGKPILLDFSTVW